MDKKIVDEKIEIQNLSETKDEITDLKTQISDLQIEIREQNHRINLYGDIFNSSILSTVITDFSGKIIWVNKAFCNLTGYTFEEVSNKNPKVLKSGKHDDSFYKNLWKTIKAGNVWQGEITNKKKNGELYHEKIAITPIFDSKNEITHFVATKQDITNQKIKDNDLNELYIKYEELAYIFNQSPAIGFLWSANDDRTVEFVTENIKQFGYSPSEFYTQDLTFSDIIFPADKEKVVNETKEIIKKGKEKIKQHYRIITKKGEIRWVDSYGFVRFEDQNSVTHIQGVLLDVTERKIAEEDAKQQLEQLMQADKMIALGTLVSGVAHEINNPNNFVLLNIPLIEKIWNNALPILEQYYEQNGDFNLGDNLKYSKIKNSMPLLISGIHDGSQRIKTIVEDLKSFARKDDQGFDQEVDLNKVIKAASNLAANLISKSTDNFNINYLKVPVIVKGNKQKLEQVMINLIENSCQALSSRKESVTIDIEKDTEFAIINVRDGGKGIEQNKLKKITDPFFTTKRNKGGTGLGLSITSKIIMQHKGSLNFDSKENVGTTATIKIPLKKA
ncbi:MAG: PAS domain S-box protein [Ignavibacteriales bacterium]|nr:PAS domain S-box protein [Ignavibacteriales bacterium]